MNETTNQLSRQVLALFVSAKREFGELGKLTPLKLAKLVDVEAGQVRAAERQQNIAHDAAVKLAAWCGLAWEGGAWIAILPPSEPIGEARQRARAGQAQSAGAPVSENHPCGDL